MENKIISSIYESLLELYGRRGWWPVTPGCGVDVRPHYGVRVRTEKQKLEIVLGAILTQNTTWKNAEKAIINLNEKAMIDRKILEKMEIEKLAQTIRPAGYFNQKARKIREFLKYDGPINREGLLSIWGLGPETVDSILLYAYNHPEFVVDAYTTRFLLHHGLIDKNYTYNNIKQLFQKSLSYEYENSLLVDVYKEYHALLVEHGKRYYSRKPYGISDPISNIVTKK